MSVTYRSFMLKVKQEPLPTPSEKTSTKPPLYNAISLTIVRPNPIPSLFISAVRCSFPKRVNSFGNSLAAIPTPLSSTSTVSISLFGSYDASTEIFPPIRVNLNAFLTRLVKTCRRRLSSPTSLGKCKVSSYPSLSYRLRWLEGRNKLFFLNF